jgi:hypothetical protein
MMALVKDDATDMQKVALLKADLVEETGITGSGHRQGWL